jgi:hypothetical protein
MLRLVPIALLIHAGRTPEGAAAVFSGSMLGFFVPLALIRHPPAACFWARTRLRGDLHKANTLLYCLLLALSAGLFETAGTVAGIEASAKEAAF